MFTLLVVASQFYYNAARATLKHIYGIDYLNYNTFWLLAIIMTLIFIILERFVMKKTV